MRARCLMPALLLTLANFCSFALVEWEFFSRRHISGNGSTRAKPLFQKRDDSPGEQYARRPKPKLPGSGSSNPNENRASPSKETMSKIKAIKTFERLQTPKKINMWLRDMRPKNHPSTGPFNGWSIRDQVSFVKLLQQRNAFDAIMSFLDLGKPDVKVYTTATFAVALSGHHRKKALAILKKMDGRNVEPTALTIIALLGALDGPSSVSKMMNEMEDRGVAMNTEVFNSAIYAIRRFPRSSNPDDMDWQVALNLFQKMRSKRIQPSSKTYHALLQVLSRTGKASLAMSLLQQWKSTTSTLATDDHVWGAAINVCAQAADYDKAIHLVMEMQEAGCTPTLRHCSALLKAFSRAGRDDFALATLQMMLGDTDCGDLAKTNLSLPFTSPDLIALNTVIKACSEARNLDGVMSIFERMQAGEFRDPETCRVISPDRITFHSMLQACRDPTTAREIVKEVSSCKHEDWKLPVFASFLTRIAQRQMRLSRRHRYGAVPPTSITYAHAINVCQQAQKVDLQLVECFLGWAQDDGIQPSVYMYASAIWAAQRAGSCSKALAFFNEMESLGCQPNSVAFDGVISALCENGDVEGAIAIYERAKAARHRVSLATIKVSESLRALPFSGLVAF